MHRRLARLAALVLTALPASGLAAGSPQKGIALGLFSEDPGWSYRPLLDEIAATGADHVELVVAWYLDDVGAVEVKEHPRFSAPAEAIERAIGDAHAAGLKVFLFPILRLTRQDAPDEWRGTLRPRDRAALFASYSRALVGLARLAARTRVELLSVGSELSTLDGERAPWVPLVGAVRSVYPGKLTYSGNWDHFRKVAFYDLLDYAGLCGYFALAHEGAPSGEAELTRAWRDLRVELDRFSLLVKRPLIFTEVGYLSQRGASAWPWAEGSRKPVDLDEQRRCYAAFARVWRGAPIGGVYFWNWYGWGGPTSGGYTPRGKPAAEEIRRFFKP
ncbi:MAG: hypothetical protein EXR72_04440 [Myxococcales bacterium]|nr:hypothetical protein [Myxococcales bacterium]